MNSKGDTTMKEKWQAKAIAAVRVLAQKIRSVQTIA
jgi:hypothetical protein